MKKFIIIILLLFGFSFSVILNKNYCIPIFAVKMYNNLEQGEVAKLCLKIVRGEGNVYISTYPTTGIGTQAYASIAIDAVCKLALNVDCNKYDFLFQIIADSPNVEGPSASFPMALLAFALLEDLNITLFGSTGMITSSLFISNVGGVYYKIKAAFSKNITQFYIPVGNIYDQIIYTTNQNSNGILIQTTTTKKINLLKEFKNVFYVIDLIDAIKKIYNIDYFKSFKINKDRVEKLIRIYNDVMKEAFIYLKSKLKSNKDLKELDECLNQYDYYTCSSLAFVKLINQTKRELEINLSKSDDQYLYLSLLIRKLKKEIYKLWDLIDKEKNYAYNSNEIAFELYGIMVDRLFQAENSIDIDLDRFNLKPAIDKISYVIARIESVKGWYKSYLKAKNISILPKINISDEYLKNYVTRKIDLINSQISYLSKLNPLFTQFQDEISKIEELLYNNYFLTSYIEVRSLETRIDAGLIIYSLNNIKNTNETKIYEESIKKYYNDIKNLIYLYMNINLPFLSLSYINYAKYFLDKKDYDNAIYYITLASNVLYSFKQFNINSIKFYPKKLNYINYNTNDNSKISTILFYLVLFLLLSIILIAR